MEHTIDEEIEIRGYKQKPDIIYPTDQLIETLNQLPYIDVNNVTSPVRSMPLQAVFNDTKCFFDSTYRLHKIPHVKYLRLGKVNFRLVKSVSPYKLPVFPIDRQDVLEGSILEEFHLEPQREPIILFRGIELTRPTHEQSSTTYVHEITHTQLDSLRGSIQEYYNMEVICLFNELYHSAVLSQDERILILDDKRRLFEMRTIVEELLSHKNGQKQCTRDELLNNCKYLISDLKAYNLFCIFYNGNAAIRNEILDDIQSIFDGYMTVEELLLKYDITYDSIQESPQKLIKYFNR